MQAIGLIETKGLIASIESADVMLKTADVKLVSKTIVGGGLVTITIEGDVAAVKASIDAAVSAVQNLDRELLISNHVIPRPVDDLSRLFEINKNQKDDENLMNVEELQEEIIQTIEDIVIEETQDVEVETLPEDNSNSENFQTENSEENSKIEVEEISQEEEKVSNETKPQKFNIKAIDKKNFKRVDLEKIYEDFGKKTSLKVLESLNLAELKKLVKEYDEFNKDINISKISKAKLIEHIINIIK